MANVKGNPENLKSFPTIGREPLGKSRGVRFDAATEIELEKLGTKAQKFIRDAVAEKLERDAIA